MRSINTWALRMAFMESLTASSSSGVVVSRLPLFRMPGAQKKHPSLDFRQVRRIVDVAPPDLSGACIKLCPSRKHQNIPFDRLLWTHGPGGGGRGEGGREDQTHGPRNKSVNTIRSEPFDVPAVSTSRTVLPPHVHSTATASRVSPGVGPVSALSSRSTALSREDLPAGRRRIETAAREKKNRKIRIGRLLDLVVPLAFGCWLMASFGSPSANVKREQAPAR